MNFSSKSILSPGHSDKSREPTLSFSSSLSRRRLRSNGSISSSSPMFPTGSKKRGCAFDTPEPSSPKVTCIGQVRVNTKKKKKQLGNKNRNGGNVVSFRKATTDHRNDQQEEGIDCLPQRNPKWVHLPFTICEALRSFGADFNCFQPCGGRSCSSASTSERDNKEEKRTATIPTGRTTATTSSCGAIFLRWLMALQEGERVEEKRRRMDIGEEEVERDRIKLVDEMEIEEEEEKRELDDEEEEEELEEARVSICIPPKNALLLMRCRSDPLRMSSLANRFWDSPVTKVVEDDDDDDEYYDQESDDNDVEVQEEGRDQQEELEMNQESEDDDDDEVQVEVRNEQQVVEEMNQELEEKLESEKDILEEEEEQEQVKSLEGDNNLEKEKEEEEEKDEVEEVVVMVNGFSTEALDSPILEEPKLEKRDIDDGIGNEEKLELDNGFSPETENLEEPKLEERVMDAEKEEEEEEEIVNGSSSSSSSPETLEIPSLDENPNPTLQEEEMDERKEGGSSSSSPEVEELIELLEEEKPTLAEEVAFLYLDERIEKSIEEEEEEEEEEKKVVEEEEEEIHEQGNEEKERIVHHQLPDCLLLMLYEPKLSMEVSKETWVCSTDFIRKKHRREVMLINGGDLCKKRINFNSDSNNPTAEVVVAHHPPASMASLIEQKLVNAVAYEPLVLTRCKSEPPLRSFSAKLGF